MLDAKDRFHQALGRMIGITRKNMRNRLQKILIKQGYEVTAEQLIVLCNLWHREGMNQQQISEILDNNKTSTTRMIDGLEKRNLAVRVPDKTDRRQNMIYLTHEGKSLCPKLIEVVDWVHEEALKGVTKKQLMACKEVLEIIMNNLSKLDK
ncbi:MAG: MarR family transcriptional regulator [candidate division Zixibacteria bacterium]